MMGNEREKLLIEQINLYYLQSFRMEPDLLTESFLGIIGTLSQLQALSKADQKKLNKRLNDILAAQGRRDFVSIRDTLWYEIKPLIMKYTA